MNHLLYLQIRLLHRVDSGGLKQVRDRQGQHGRYEHEKLIRDRWLQVVLRYMRRHVLMQDLGRGQGATSWSKTRFEMWTWPHSRL